MEHVAGDEDHLGRELDDLVDGSRERLRHIRFALVDSARSQPLVLAVSEVQVGEVDEAQKLGGPGMGEEVAARQAVARAEVGSLRRTVKV